MSAPNEPTTILARRHPLAVLALHGFDLCATWVLLSPIAEAIAADTGHHPGGDAVLFRPGGMLLVESLRLHVDTLAVLLPATAWQLVLAALIGLVPLAAAMHALAAERRLGPREALARGVASFPAFTALAGVSLLARAAAGLLVLWFAVVLRGSLTAPLGERTADLVTLGALGGAVPLVLGVGALEDLARAEVVRAGASALEAVHRCFRSVRAAPIRILLEWLAPTTASLGVLLASATVPRWIGLDRPGEFVAMELWILLQLAALAQVALRVSWLAAALRRAAPGRPT